jgi:anaerobic selenocysteine-containing dehydrogenase
VGKGTVTFDDFEHADAIFVWARTPAPTTRACSTRCATR